MKRIVLIALLLLVPVSSHAFMGESMLRAQCQLTGGSPTNDTSIGCSANDCGGSGGYCTSATFTTTGTGNIIVHVSGRSGDISETDVALYKSNGTLVSDPFTYGTGDVTFSAQPAGSYYIVNGVTCNYDCANQMVNGVSYIH